MALEKASTQPYLIVLLETLKSATDDKRKLLGAFSDKVISGL